MYLYTSRFLADVVKALKCTIHVQRYFISVFLVNLYSIKIMYQTLLMRKKMCSSNSNFKFCNRHFNTLRWQCMVEGQQEPLRHLSLSFLLYRKFLLILNAYSTLACLVIHVHVYIDNNCSLVKSPLRISRGKNKTATFNMKFWE